MARSLFISDLHLSEERPAANEAFISFVEKTAPRADALYILGDFFEYWVGDDDLGAPFPAVIAGFLRGLHQRGVKLYFMHGNRDFLVGARFCEQTGAKLLEDPTIVDVGGVKTLLMHGDTLCTDDTDYQEWRRTVRAPGWQSEFAAKPLAERHDLTRGLRERSKRTTGATAMEIMDVSAAAVQEAFREHGVSRMIHGHTHRPGRHALQVEGRRCERWVLPDWYGRGGYLEIGTGAPRLARF